MDLFVKCHLKLHIDTDIDTDCVRLRLYWYNGQYNTKVNAPAARR